MTLKIVHWINISRLFRCHMTFKDDDKHTHYYYVYEITRGTQNFKKPNMIIGNIRDPLLLEKELSKLKPDVVICSNLIDKHLMELVRKHTKYFIYITHAIWSNDIIENKCKDPSSIEPYNIFDRIYCQKKESKMFVNNGVCPDKIFIIHGVIYFDEVINRNYSLTRKKIYDKYVKEPGRKSILFIHNCGYYCRNIYGKRKNPSESSDDYQDILTKLAEYAEKNFCHIFCKIKRQYIDIKETKQIKELHNLPYITVIKPEEEDCILSKFLFCDAIIMQNYGTSFLESILVNSKVALCFYNSEISLNLAKYHMFPLIINLSDIDKILDNMLDNPRDYDTSEYKTHVTKFIHDQLNGPLDNVTDIIMNDIDNHFTKIDK